MKRVYTVKDPLMIGHLKNVLATFGIKCVTKNFDLSSGAGELPPIECWPELWVVEDEKLAKARMILKKTLAAGGRADGGDRPHVRGRGMDAARAARLGQVERTRSGDYGAIRGWPAFRPSPDA